MTAEKVCVACGATRPTSDFYRDSRRSDGLNRKCRDCARAYQRKRTGASPRKQATAFDPLGFAICTKCGELKMHTEFYRRGDFIRPACKRCHDAANRKRAQTRTPEQITTYRLQQRKTYWEGGGAERVRARELTYRFNICIDQYEFILRGQGGVCAICRQPEQATDSRTGRVRALAVDHDHKCCPERGRSCGRCIRGLLCSRCNAGLGHFRDDPDLLAAASDYLDGAAATNRLGAA